MKKFILDLKVSSVEALSPKHVLIKLTDAKPLPDMLPGQFVEVRVDDSPTTFLRRPISINFVDRTNNELWLLVAAIGDGTRRLSRLQQGDTLNCVLPLGNGFTMPREASEKANTRPTALKRSSSRRSAAVRAPSRNVGSPPCSLIFCPK